LEIGINFNGDLPPESIIKGSKVAEATGFHFVWIGETPEHTHPFPLIAMISKWTRTVRIGTGVISPLINHYHHIKKAFQTLQEVYGNRFVIGLAPGDLRSLKIVGASKTRPLGKLKKCIIELKKGFDSLNAPTKNELLDKSSSLNTPPIYVGASGPKMVKLGSRIADGVILNYIDPDFLKWASKFFRKHLCYKVAYGPTLLEPDEKNLMLLRISAAIVFSGSNKVFLKEFNLEDSAFDVSRILKKKQYQRLGEYDDILLKKFALYGSLHEIEERVDKLTDLGMNQIVFATPLCRNIDSVKKLGIFFQEY
jgi:5,10-methylenetetrahydromethanopterin reductase